MDLLPPTFLAKKSDTQKIFFLRNNYATNKCSIQETQSHSAFHDRFQQNLKMMDAS